MAQVDVETPNPARASLRSLERVGKGAAIANEIFGLVGRSLFFAEFSREDISILAGYMDVYRAQTGETIIRENDGGDFMLLIIEGAVDIFKRGMRAGQQHMTNVGPGMTLGEMSMIDGEPRFATCVRRAPPRRHGQDHPRPCQPRLEDPGEAGLDAVDAPAPDQRPTAAAHGAQHHRLNAVRSTHGVSE
jgi:hypothetical protein